MKSKEIIQRLKDDIEIGYLSTKHDNQKDKENYLFMLEIVKKDLEVLKILKRHSTILDDEDWDSNIFNGIDYENLDEEERKVIKDWLENE